MNENLVWIIVIIAAVILVPVLLKLYRDWDFKRQITGKRPIRTLKENEKVPGDAPEGNPEIEGMVDKAKMDTFVNLKRNLGPH